MRFVLAFAFFMGLAFSSVSCVSTNIVAMAEKDNLRGVKNALEKGTQIDMQNRDGRTALMQASIYGNIRIVELLLDRGASLHSKDSSDGWEEGYTALHHAVAHSNSDEEKLKTIEFLIDKGADINAKAKYDRTPLHAASWAKNVKGAELLIAKGADINGGVTTGEHSTPLHNAASMGNIKGAELLIEKGANINAKGKFKNIPLHLAFENANFRVANLLIENGADINAINFLLKKPSELIVRIGMSGSDFSKLGFGPVFCDGTKPFILNTDSIVAKFNVHCNLISFTKK